MSKKHSSSKIGRNDPCPCGSGKKYKKCCLFKSEHSKSNSQDSESNSSEMGAYEAFLNNYDQSHLLSIIAALQLIPKNHGKNVRFEMLAKDIVAKGLTNSNPIPYHELVGFFQKNIKFHHLEDPVTSFFTENVIFYGGNSIVFPGINHNGTRILNHYLESIFKRKTRLTNEFKKEIHDGVTVILQLSDALAYRAGLTRWMFEDDNERAIRVPDKNELEGLINAVTFTKEDIESLLEAYNLPHSAFQQFVVNPDNPDLQEEDETKNPLLTQPIFQDGENYVFALPSVVVNCLVEFIQRKSEELGCKVQLFETYFEHQWNRTRELAYKIGWKETDISLPTASPSSTVYESVFEFDNDKLAYLCLLTNNVISPSDSQTESTQENSSTKKRSETSFSPQARANVVLQYLESLKATEGFRYFTVFIIGEAGFDFYFLWDKPKDGNQTIGLIFGDLEKIALSQGIDKLTLWKFAKAYQRAKEGMRFSPFTSMLDAYVIYLKNANTLNPVDEAKPTLMHIALGNSTEFEHQILLKRDEHSALKWFKGTIAYATVIKTREYAPIYNEKEYHDTIALLLECYHCPLWVTYQGSLDKHERYIAKLFCEAIVFWLYKMRNDLKQYLERIDDPIEIRLSIDEGIINNITQDSIKEIPIEKININVAVEGNIVYLDIPFELMHLLLQPNNNAEKLLLRKTLFGIRAILETQNIKQILSDESISTIVDKVLTPAQAKMVLFFDSTYDLRMDNRWLIGHRDIQESDISVILENLVADMKLTFPIPSKIVSRTDKKNLCNQVVTTLLHKLVDKLKEYESMELLSWIMRMYESCIQQREFREIQIPAQIACFSDFKTEVKKLRQEEKKLVNTSLALRCIIELIVAKPSYGKKLVNYDDLDELLAIMDSIINWGALSDSIMYEMADPEMGLLPSGRIGIDKGDEVFLDEFAGAKLESELYNWWENFETKIDFSIKDDEPLEENRKTTGQITPEEIDSACKSEWGISLTKLFEVKKFLIKVAIENQDSIAILDEKDFINQLKTHLPNFTDDEIKSAMHFLILREREDIFRSPKGFLKDDIYPWKYKRALSYLQKPILNIKTPGGKSTLLWSFRHIISSFENLRNLVLAGTISCKQGGEMNKLFGRISKIKGKLYQEKVAEWLTAEGVLQIFPHEVTIGPNGVLLAPQDLGDIDILAIETGEKIFYSIECKNTVAARAIHEMKTELDNYLGRDGQPGLIEKHFKRDEWLKGNKEKIKISGVDYSDYSIKSIVLTSDDIPTNYLAKQKIPIPIFSFTRLIREGSKIFLGT